MFEASNSTTCYTFIIQDLLFAILYLVNYQPSNPSGFLLHGLCHTLPSINTIVSGLSVLYMIVLGMLLNHHSNVWPLCLRSLPFKYVISRMDTFRH